MPAGGTVTTMAKRVEPPRRASAAVLCRVLTSDRPTEAPVRFVLAGIDRVLLGRGEQTRIDRQGRDLVLCFADSRMSASHATLTRSGRRWLLEDAGSKNGTALDGARVSRVLIRDGQIIEVGHTFLILREAVDVEENDPLDADAEALRQPDEALVTLSLPLRHELERLARVAEAPVSLIVTGESGTGKEVIARAMHRLSGRRGPFVAVNCGAIPEALVESELFGSQRGAFSGAEPRPGLVRSADGGTLFLDEIGELPERAQPALLRVLQEHEVMALGSVRAVTVDVRVIAATNRDLDTLVQRGGFRGDLLARLAGYRITLPPLRDRREDVGLLVGAILRRLARDAAHRVRFTRDAARALIAYDWPMNVRELEKALASALALARESPIGEEDLPAHVRAAVLAAPEGADVDAAERPLRERVIALLREHHGNVAAVARALGKARTQVHRWIERFGIDVDVFRV